MAGDTTSISGVVYDPAGKNPVYNAQVYVLDPSSPLPDLANIPLGCGCSQLMPKKVLARSAPTDESGHFEIPCAPSGTQSLVVQRGKWRRQYDGVQVARDRENVIPNLRLPANSSEGSLPNIAISTGGTDSMECLLLRMGVSASEYVVGSAPQGHVHIYTGWKGASLAEGSVDSNNALWDSQAHLNEHDLVVLSCEGQETTGGSAGTSHLSADSQQYMLKYASSGGRVLADHYQYAWFNRGPFAAKNLVAWETGSGAVEDGQFFAAQVDTTLSSGVAFPEGSSLLKWLGLIGALNNGQMPILSPHTNVKALLHPSATEWLRLSATNALAPSATQLFSVDMPLGASGSAVCGRIAYSTMHLAPTPPKTNVDGVLADYYGAGGAGGAGGSAGFPFPTSPPPGVVPSGCVSRPLTPQEAALEFMLFDLTSCLVPIGEAPRQQ